MMSLDNLSDELDKKLSIVQNSLSVIAQQNDIHSTNASKLQCQISEAIELHINSLKKREKLLLRQVELVLTHQKSLLNAQSAELLHQEGALLATKDLLTQCDDSDAPTLNKVQIPELPNIQSDRILQSIALVMDDSKLCSVISEYGQVRLPDQIVQNSSSILPNKMEDYGDSDHDILHKSVASTANQSDNTSVQVRIPRLPRSRITKLKLQARNPVLNHRQKRKIPNLKNPSHEISRWLNSSDHLNKEEFDESSSVQEDIFSDNTESSSLCDMLLKEYQVIDGDKDLSPCNRASTSSSSIEVVSRVSSVQSHCWCAESCGCEIESLDKIVGDKSRWLSVRSEVPEAKVSVSEACCANDPCKSFSECICERNCEESAREKAQQSANWKALQNQGKLEISPEPARMNVVEQVKKISEIDRNLWLKRPISDVAVDERPSKCASNVSPPTRATQKPKLSIDFEPVNLLKKCSLNGERQMPSCGGNKRLNEVKNEQTQNHLFNNSVVAQINSIKSVKNCAWSKNGSSMENKPNQTNKSCSMLDIIENITNSDNSRWLKKSPHIFPNLNTHSGRSGQLFQILDNVRSKDAGCWAPNVPSNKENYVVHLINNLTLSNKTKPEKENVLLKTTSTNKIENKSDSVLNILNNITSSDEFWSKRTSFPNKPTTVKQNKVSDNSVMLMNLMKSPYDVECNKTRPMVDNRTNNTEPKASLLMANLFNDTKDFELNYLKDFTKPLKVKKEIEGEKEVTSIFPTLSWNKI